MSVLVLVNDNTKNRVNTTIMVYHACHERPKITICQNYYSKDINYDTEDKKLFYIWNCNTK